MFIIGIEIFAKLVYNVSYGKCATFIWRYLFYVKNMSRMRTFGKQKANVNEYALKGLVGHYMWDITENVYTDRPMAWLREEIKKNKMSCRNDVRMR